MSDHAEAISNLLGYSTDEGYMKHEPILNLFDTNNNNYLDGRVNFDTQTLINTWVDYHNGYLELDMKITGTNLNSAEVGIALKNGIYQLVSSMQLKINNIDVINNDYLPPYNSIRLYLTGDQEWEQTHGDLYLFAMDSQNKTEIVQLSGTPVTGYNADYNEGMDRRVEIFNLMRTNGIASATEFTFTARVPLKMIHPYFEALDRPLINARLQATFTISWINGNQFNPLVLATGTTATVTKLEVTKGKLVAYRCEFKPETAIKINQNLAKGMVVDTTFWQAKHFRGTESISVTRQDFQITSGIKAPRRVIVMFQNATDWASSASCVPAVTHSYNKITKSNLEINNERVFQQDIENDYEHYKLLQRAMFSGEDQNSNGCLIPYRSFLKNNYAYYIYDISTNKYIIKDPNASVQLRYIAEKQLATGGNPNAELHCFVEHECNVTINMTTSEVMKTGD